MSETQLDGFQQFLQPTQTARQGDSSPIQQFYQARRVSVSLHRGLRHHVGFWLTKADPLVSSRSRHTWTPAISLQTMWQKSSKTSHSRPALDAPPKFSSLPALRQNTYARRTPSGVQYVVFVANWSSASAEYIVQYRADGLFIGQVMDRLKHMADPKTRYFVHAGGDESPTDRRLAHPSSQHLPLRPSSRSIWYGKRRCSWPRLMLLSKQPSWSLTASYFVNFVPVSPFECFCRGLVC